MGLRYRWNPFTGRFDQVIPPAPALGTTFRKKTETITAPILSTKTILLDAAPVADSEMVHLNGLLLDDSCYTVSGVSIIFDGSANIALGDFVDIRYVE